MNVHIHWNIFIISWLEKLYKILELHSSNQMAENNLLKSIYCFWLLIILIYMYADMSLVFAENLKLWMKSGPIAASRCQIHLVELCMWLIGELNHFMYVLRLIIFAGKILKFIYIQFYMNWKSVFFWVIKILYGILVVNLLSYFLSHWFELDIYLIEMKIKNVFYTLHTQYTIMYFLQCLLFWLTQSL